MAEMPVPTQSVQPFLRVRNAGKRYGAVTALSGVTLDFFPGEVHAVVGENGAGKSTLMRLLAGEETPSDGQILVAGYGDIISSPQHARTAGIAVVHQQFQLVETLTVAENIFLGRPARRIHLGPLSVASRRAMLEEARRRLQPFGLASRAGNLIRNLTVAEKQLVEICKALDGNARMLILDEPTASLGDAEIHTLLRHVEVIRSRGAAVVLIAHNIDEVLSVADRISVLRNGRLVDSQLRQSVRHEDLVRMIVGRDVDRRYPKGATVPGETVLEAQGLLREREGREGGTLGICRGEILGMPSFIGSMVDDLLDRLSGAARFAGTSLRLESTDVKNTSIGSRIRQGLAFVPGNTLAEGLVPGFSIEDNILLPNLRKFRWAGVVNRRYLRRTVEALIIDLNIRPANPKALVKDLSGGNRQKVVLAKWLASGASVFIMNDPTKAVDVGAKAEIYGALAKVVEAGGAVLLASSDTDELIGLSDRIVVVRAEEVVARFSNHSVDKEKLLAAVVGSSGKVFEVRT